MSFFGVLVDGMNAQWEIISIKETGGHRPSLLRFNHISGVEVGIYISREGSNRSPAEKKSQQRWIWVPTINPFGHVRSFLF